MESQMYIVVQISFIFIRTKMYVQVKGAVAFGFALALAGQLFYISGNVAGHSDES